MVGYAEVQTGTGLAPDPWDPESSGLLYQDIDREEVQGTSGSNDGRYVRQPEPRGHAVYSMLAQSAIRAIALMGRGQERRSTPGAAQSKAEIVYYSTLGKELSEISPVSYSN